MYQQHNPNLKPNEHAHVVTIQRNDMTTFDEAFSSLRDKFTSEMKRIEEEMDNLSSELMKIYHQTASHKQPPRIKEEGTTQCIAASPLIQGDGDDKMLRLQFDVSQFDPSEVRVTIEEDTLTVTAYHEENTNHSNVMRSFRRDFILPKEVDPDSVISALSRDGVLTVQAPLAPLALDHTAEF